MRKGSRLNKNRISILNTDPIFDIHFPSYLQISLQLPQFCRDQARVWQRLAAVEAPHHGWGSDAPLTTCMSPHCGWQGGEQAVRSLGPLSYTCYQAHARGLSTRWSAWDLDLLQRRWEVSSWERLRA